MAAPLVMHGARAKVGIVDPNTGLVTVVGIYSNVSWNLTYDTPPVYILGAYAPAAIENVAQEPVSLTATGWRVVGHGAHKDGRVPKLADLLTSEYLVFTIIDRQTNRRIATIRDVRPTGYSTALSARQLEEMTMGYIGRFCDDEDTDNSERADSTFLPS